jgi:hypothetical protein
VFLYRRVLGVYDGKVLGMPLIAQFPLLFYWKPTLKVGQGMNDWRELVDVRRPARQGLLLQTN